MRRLPQQKGHHLPFTLGGSVGAHTPSAATAGAAVVVLAASARHGAMEGFLRQFSRLGKDKARAIDERRAAYNQRKQPHEYTSKDVLINAGMPGGGYDPVYMHHATQSTLSPLRRRGADDLTSFLNAEEQGKWMDAKGAARVLGIKEADLPTLTMDVLERAFVKAYKGSPPTRQAEVQVAAESLVDYLYSSAYTKKSRDYYKRFIERTRAEVDEATQRTSEERKGKIMWFTAAAFTVGCCTLLTIAYLRSFVTAVDMSTVGAKLHDYYVITFAQAPNLEPAPDYQTRYATTPTSLELDRRSGRLADAFETQTATRVREAKEEFDRREEAELLRMLNDGNEEAAAAAAAAQQQQQQQTGAGVGAGQSADGAGATPGMLPKDASGFRAFAAALSTSMGGGSRFERLTRDTSARGDELRAMEERLEAQRRREQREQQQQRS